MIVIPAYAAIVRGWFGAWPMPLGWERPWQVIHLSPELYIRELGSCSWSWLLSITNAYTIILLTGVAYMRVLWSYRRLHCWTYSLIESDGFAQ